MMMVVMTMIMTAVMMMVVIMMFMMVYIHCVFTFTVPETKLKKLTCVISLDPCNSLMRY